MVREKLPNAELWVLGDGPFKEDVGRMSCDGVRFFGRLSSAERREKMRRGWVLVNPSVREGWGLNVVEANALGMPCVACDVHGLRDSVKDGVTGLLVENGNVKVLAENLTKVLNDRNLRSELSSNALEYSRKFNWDKCARETLAPARGVSSL